MPLAVHDISTSVWHGARLHDVLLRCDVMGATDDATNVCFVGGGDDNYKYDTGLQRISNLRFFLPSINKRGRREQSRRWGSAGAAAGA